MISVFPKIVGLFSILIASTLGLSGCNTTKPSPSDAVIAAPAAFAPSKVDREANREALDTIRSTALSGRTLRVSSIADIRLRDKEVILTFDDGPVKGRTDAILNALGKQGVKATFLMVGTMVKTNPSLARRVAANGHAIGSHTCSHGNLAGMSIDRAIADIKCGEAAIRSAGIRDVPFFRFPYLADTSVLRRHLADRGVVVLDVDIDSKDYFKISPASVASQTMARVRAKGKGIILFHDLQPRTVAMLPSFLNELKREGYKVVNLQASRGAALAFAGN